MTLSGTTVLSPQQRAALSTDPDVGGGNLLPSAIAANPHPDVPFLRSLRPLIDTDGRPRTEFSLLDIDRLAQAWSAWYLAKGVRPRCRVAVHLDDSFAYSIHFYALAQIGAIAVLINSNASREIVLSLCRQTNPVGLFTEPHRLTGFEDGLTEVPSVEWVHTTQEVPAPPPATLPDSRRYHHQSEDPVALLHSSGTTGVAKPTIHTHRSIVSGPKFRLVDHAESRRALTLTALPQSHLGCIAYTTYAVLAGARTIAGYDHPGAHLAKTVAKHRPTAVMSFAHAYSELAAVDLPPGVVDSVTAWVSIGDAVHEAHIKRVLGQRSRHLPPAAFLDRLGTTELGWGVLLKTRTLATERNDRCAGKPVGVAQVTILRENGTPADTNEIGFLAAKGPAITPGYWNNSDLTYTFTLAGYWLTGDNAYRDENGDFFLVDRAVDAIETENGVGYSVFMEEVILTDVPDVVDCAVIAGRDAGRVVPVAVLTIGTAEVEPEKLLRRANEALRVAGHPGIAVLEIGRRPEDLPVGVTGKVLKRDLREKYADLATYLRAAHPGNVAAA